MEQTPKTKLTGVERVALGVMLGWGVCVAVLLAAVTWFHMFPSIPAFALRLLAASLFTPMLLLVCALSAFDRQATRGERLWNVAAGAAALTAAWSLYSFGFTIDRASLDGALVPVVAFCLWEVARAKYAGRRGLGAGAAKS